MQPGSHRLGGKFHLFRIAEEKIGNNALRIRHLFIVHPDSFHDVLKINIHLSLAPCCQ